MAREQRPPVEPGAIWIGNSAWGTAADQLTMFLVGTAAFIGTAAIQTMRTNTNV